ncbi:MAG TPA: hypothetical protein VFS57_02465, partial [Gemmatimonadaceae bacterium]|nr:hypothetical protein [Gemmatimonadaceae bacterium]
WAYITVVGGGGAGFIEERHLAVGPPEPAANLHAVKGGERLGKIAADVFGAEITGGNDARLYVQAIYEANKGRAGIRLDAVDLTLRESMPRQEAEEETLKIYKGVKVIEGQAIWVPSKEFVQQLKASGSITTGSTALSKGWRAGKAYARDVVEVAEFDAGMIVGVLEGAYEAIRDIFKSAVDMLRMAFEIVKANITGHLLDLVIDAAKKLKQFIVHLPDIAKALGSHVAERWTSAGPFGKGQFVGEVVGYVAANVLVVLATGGGAVAVMLARAAESGSQLARAVMLLVKAADLASNPLKLLEGAGKGATISEEAAAKLKQALARDAGTAGKIDHGAEDAGKVAHRAHDVDAYAPKRAQMFKGRQHGQERRIGDSGNRSSRRNGPSRQGEFSSRQ